MSPDSLSALRLSLEVAVSATALNALVGIPIAYLLARRRFWGRNLVDLLVTLPLILPPTVVGYYLIVLLGRRGVLGAPLYRATGFTVAFTWYAAVIAATVMALPLARNGILAGLVLSFARALGEFGATLMLAGNIPGRTTTVPLSIYTAMQTGEDAEALVLVAVLTALSCVVLIASNRLVARPA